MSLMSNLEIYTGGIVPATQELVSSYGTEVVHFEHVRYIEKDDLM